jgi:hypothetical protein
VLATSGEEIIDLLKGGQGVLNIVPLAGVVQELDAAILELAGTGAATAETPVPVVPVVPPATAAGG